MKILAFSCREDEEDLFYRFGEKYGAEMILRREAPRMDRAELARGIPCVSIVTTPFDGKMMEAFYAVGVRMVSTRTVGYDHMDVARAKELGMAVGNVAYPPEGVADYAVMLILMSIRRAGLILARGAVQDYSLRGVRGRELHNLTVGVIGTGRIGRRVIQNLRGFGCRILAYDLHPGELEGNARYVPMDTLLDESDVITLHTPATADNTHLIDREAIAKMKPGVLIVNTARGSLIKTEALAEGLERGRIGGAALDVVEHESGIYYRDLKGVPLDNREMALLRSFPNVILTPHTAFYTDQAVSDMVEKSIESCVAFMREQRL